MFEGFPHVVSASSSGIGPIADLWRARRDEIDRDLLTYGAIVFTGYRVDTADKFGEFMGGLSLPLGNYVDGNSPRTKLTDAVYTSTEYPPELPISLHNELSYSDVWPARLYFCCVSAAASGGSTTIADSRRIHDTMPARIADEFERKGVMYVRNLQSEGGMGVGKTWQSTFETDDRALVEAHCLARNIRYEWHDDAMLRLIQVRPGFAAHPLSGERVWFNQADQFHPSTNPPDTYEALMEIYGDTPFEMPQYSCFGDGSAMSDDLLTEVRAVIDAQQIAPRWETGDIMVIDNMLCAHGRSPFTGARKVLVAMSGYQTGASASA
jgi:alpha-ketoglutarate-dependent taurine dioxygenase